jgi:hypothetical protein
MKKRKPEAASSKRPSPKRPAPAQTMDLAEIRRQITELVGNGALGMVETTIDEVGKGHYLGMKYLFEMIGLYPAAPTDDAPEQDSLAAILLRRLGVPEAAILEESVTKDSGTAAAAGENGLE